MSRSLIQMQNDVTNDDVIMVSFKSETRIDENEWQTNNKWNGFEIVKLGNFLQKGIATDEFSKRITKTSWGAYSHVIIEI